jgi:5-methylcytosine-specific restriction protein A
VLKVTTPGERFRALRVSSFARTSGIGLVMPDRARQYRPKSTAPALPARPDARRGSRHQRGYNAHWSRFAKSYLREHPLCVTCRSNGRVEAAYCVDHKDNKGPLGERGYDPENLQALCESCHNRKTAHDRHAHHKDTT